MTETAGCHHSSRNTFRSSLSSGAGISPAGRGEARATQHLRTHEVGPVKGVPPFAFS